VLGPRHPFLAYPLTGIGVAHWKSGQADRALAPLERALAIREASEPDLAQRAETRFALARALWDADPGHGKDRGEDRGEDRRQHRAQRRARARRLAAMALADYQRPPTKDRQLQKQAQQKLDEVAGWLAAHHQD
jgi:hypothetical protein